MLSGEVKCLWVSTRLHFSLDTPATLGSSLATLVQLSPSKHLSVPALFFALAKKGSPLGIHGHGGMAHLEKQKDFPTFLASVEPGSIRPICGERHNALEKQRRREGILLLPTPLESRKFLWGWGEKEGVTESLGAVSCILEFVNQDHKCSKLWGVFPFSKPFQGLVYLSGISINNYIYFSNIKICVVSLVLERWPHSYQGPRLFPSCCSAIVNMQLQFYLHVS
jgi:hypothetical protein